MNKAQHILFFAFFVLAIGLAGCSPKVEIPEAEVATADTVEEEEIVMIGLCMSTCPYADDGECDDGGEGSDTSVCSYGTDCGDCGARDDADEHYAEPEPSGGQCTNTCTYANDGDCDDGGPGADYSLCDYGTDCGDCGSRYGEAPAPEPEPQPEPTPADPCDSCLDSCRGLSSCCTGMGCICEDECAPAPGDCGPGTSFCCGPYGDCLCLPNCPY